MEWVGGGIPNGMGGMAERKGRSLVRVVCSLIYSCTAGAGTCDGREHEKSYSVSLRSMAYRRLGRKIEEWKSKAKGSLDSTRRRNYRRQTCGV